MDAGTQSEFNDLCFHWDEVYEIKFDEGAGIWSARYRSAFDQLTAGSCDELRQAIRSRAQLEIGINDLLTNVSRRPRATARPTGLGTRPESST